MPDESLFVIPANEAQNKIMLLAVEPAIGQPLVESIDYHLRYTVGKAGEKAGREDVLRALAHFVRARLIDGAIATQERVHRTAAKRLVYLPAEFLVGLSLRNNLFNLGLLREAEQATRALGFDLRMPHGCGVRMRSAGLSPLQTISNASQEEYVDECSFDGSLGLIGASFAFCVAATRERGGIKFPIFSKHATGVTLVLYKSGIPEPLAGSPMAPSINRPGNIWHAFVSGIEAGIQCEYRMNPRCEPGPLAQARIPCNRAARWCYLASLGSAHRCTSKQMSRLRQPSMRARSPAKQCGYWWLTTIRYNGWQRYLC